DRTADVRRHERGVITHLGLADFERLGCVVELLGKPGERLVAAAAHGVDDVADALVECGVRAFITPEQRVNLPCVSCVDDLHGTILFSGYSTMPVAPAAFSFGIRSRTCSSVRIVLTATHDLSLNAEIVGFFIAGSSLMISSSLSAGAFIIRPT